jgi:hypothetical protein
VTASSRRALMLPLELGRRRIAPPAGRPAQRREQAAEQPVVIERPVERRRAEDGVGAAGDRQRRGVGLGEGDPAPDTGPHGGARRGQHVGRRSMPMARPCGSRPASSSVSRPVPQPTSSTVVATQRRAIERPVPRRTAGSTRW